MEKLPELETLDYKPPSNTKPSPEAKEKTTPIIEPETGVENRKVVGQQLEQPKEDKLIVACGVLANPGPLENLQVTRIETDLVNIAANLEMLRDETCQQRRAKCKLALEIAGIRGNGGLLDDLKEAFE